MKRLGLIIFLLIVICTLYSCGHEHSFSEWSIKTEATCSSEGEKTRECECGETESDVIEKKEHQIITISPIAPTCTSMGYTAGSCCSVCGYFATEPQPILPTHNYIPAVISVPTCTAKGTIKHTCSECKASYIEETEALGHNIIGETCTTPKTCSVCDATFGLALEHTVKLGLCKRCEQFVQPEIILPDFPVSAFVEIEGYKTEMLITELTYRFTGNSIVFTYSGIKTADEGELTDGRYFCGFSYRLYDAEGNLTTSGTSSVSNLSAGETFRDEHFYIVSLPDISDFYTLVIEDYTITNN